MNSSVAGRLAPSNVLYSNDPKWQHQQNASKSPSRHTKCKCKEIIERKKEDDCDNCSINEEIRIRKDAQMSSRNVDESPKSTKRDLNNPKERPSSGKLQRKQLLSPSKHETPTRGSLEKSNSLTESKPQKQLRTTKSLSPRPPIKHQHAITVSDEYNVVSLKVSPADDFDDVLIKDTRMDISDSSPEGVAGSLQLDDRHKNHRSTSCLVYVPSDPWTKMEPGKGRKKGGSRMKKLMDVKSLSRPDLVDDDDPWVFDESRKIKDKKSATFRNTHSKSLHVESKSGTARPRLQRSKSPVFDEHLKNPPSSPNNLLVLKDPLSSLSPKLGYHSVPDDKSNKAKKKSQFLNVSNPNLLQPRHSFSTSASKKDDELTLNIRRLSEQIKHSSNYASYGNFSSAGNTANTSPKPGEMEKKSSSLLSDSLLETTC